MWFVILSVSLVMVACCCRTMLPWLYRLLLGREEMTILDEDGLPNHAHPAHRQIMRAYMRASVRRQTEALQNFNLLTTSTTTITATTESTTTTTTTTTTSTTISSNTDGTVSSQGNFGYPSSGGGTVAANGSGSSNEFRSHTMTSNENALFATALVESIPVCEFRFTRAFARSLRTNVTIDGIERSNSNAANTNGPQMWFGSGVASIRNKWQQRRNREANQGVKQERVASNTLKKVKRTEGQKGQALKGREMVVHAPVADVQCATEYKEAPTICSICLSQLFASDMTKELHCGHAYHSSCLDQWLRLRGVCPLCQRPALPPQKTQPLPCRSQRKNQTIFLMKKRSKTRQLLLVSQTLVPMTRVTKSGSSI